MRAAEPSSEKENKICAHRNPLAIVFERIWLSPWCRPCANDRTFVRCRHHSAGPRRPTEPLPSRSFLSPHSRTSQEQRNKRKKAYTFFMISRSGFLRGGSPKGENRSGEWCAARDSTPQCLACLEAPGRGARAQRGVRSPKDKWGLREKVKNQAGGGIRPPRNRVFCQGGERFPVRRPGRVGWECKKVESLLDLLSTISRLGGSISYAPPPWLGLGLTFGKQVRVAGNPCQCETATLKEIVSILITVVSPGQGSGHEANLLGRRIKRRFSSIPQGRPSVRRGGRGGFACTSSY